MTAWIYLLTAALSIIAAYLTRSYLVQRQLLDIPNERSSHAVPVPRGGGISFTLVYLMLLLGWLMLNPSAQDFLLPLALCGGLLAGVGFVDDRRGLSSGLRLLLQLLCLGAAVVYIFQNDLGIGIGWYYSGLLLLLIGTVWWINLFNFLDGIDGYAISEAILVSLVSGFLCWWQGVTDLAHLNWLLGVSVLGFTLLNWPPAKFFMGDVGSYFLGATLALLALLAFEAGVISPISWLTMTALFWVDASYTLVVRWLRGEVWYQAHRSHAYQILARRWGSHLKVTLAACVINLAWLVPLGLVCQWLINYDNNTAALSVLLLAIIPLVYLVFHVKAGVIND